METVKKIQIKTCEGFETYHQIEGGLIPDNELSELLLARTGLLDLRTWGILKERDPYLMNLFSGLTVYPLSLRANRLPLP